MNRCSVSVAEADYGWQSRPRRPGSARRVLRTLARTPPVRQEGGGNHRALAEALREPVHRAREALAAAGRGVEEIELARARGAGPPGREPAQPDPTRASRALHAPPRAAVDPH